MRRIAFFALAAAAAACGLSVTGVDPEPSALVLGTDGGSTLDAASDPSPAADATPNGDGAVDPPIDAGKETGPPPGCTTIEQTMNVPLDGAKWQLAGSAEQKNGRVELTDINAEANIGGLWLKQSLSWAKTLSVVVSYQVEEPFNEGTGLAIAWVKSNSTWKLGQQGPNYGICNSGLDGVAAGLLLQLNDGLQGITSVSGTCQTQGVKSGEYKHDSGKLTMILTPNNLHLASNGNTDDLPATPSLTGFVGITAATSYDSAGQSMYAITSVTIEACP